MLFKIGKIGCKYMIISNEVLISVLKVIEYNLPFCVFIVCFFLSFGTFFVFVSDNFIFDKLKSVADNAPNVYFTNYQNIWSRMNFILLNTFLNSLSTEHYFLKVEIMTLVEHICRFWMLPVNENEYICFWNLKMNNFCSYLAYISNFDWISPVPIKV